MNRIDRLFSVKGSDLLSVYFTAGYPGIDDTVNIITTLTDNGVDMIEIGIPFSDPMADGSVIQNSSNIALKNGMSLKLLFSQLKDIRVKTDIPLLLMGYLNPILKYGFEDFCRDCKDCGIDGMIIPDLPIDIYIKDYKRIVEQYGLKLTMLITPETSDDRIRKIDEEAEGFIYMVSTASTTGTKDSFDNKTIDYFKRIDKMGLKHPRMIGFGISNKDGYLTANKYSGGAIVGSLFIKLLAENSVSEGVKKLVSILRK